MQLPADLQVLCDAFLHGLEAVLGDKLYGVYLYGALTFPEGGAGGDVDFHVLLRQVLTGEEKTGLQNLHAALARDFPPAGADMDGYYLLLDDARQITPPAHQFLPGVIDNSWALHRAHIRAGRCLVLRGPDPALIYPPASWPELERALWGELEFIERHLTEYPDYCVLNLCRLMYSFQTRDVVVSKRFSAAWAGAAFPEWRPLIDGARGSYDRGHPAEDKALLAPQIQAFYDFSMEHIRASLGRPWSEGEASLR